MSTVFSVIIPTFERPGVVLGLLEQLLAQRNAPTFEIIVVDDSALPGLQEKVEALSTVATPVAYLATAHEGPGQARNFGAAEGRGRFLIFLDDDCEVAPDWLALLNNEITHSSAEIYYGPVTSRCPSYLPFLHTVEIEDSPYRSTNIAFERQLFHQLGGFDPRLSRWSEGWDLVSRARRHGAQMKYLPSWACAHKPEYVAPRYFRIGETRQTLERMLYLMRQHRDTLAVQDHLTALYHGAIWHVVFRLLFLLVPLFFVTMTRAFPAFILLNIVYDASRLAYIQHRMIRKGYNIPAQDAVKYLAFNWSEDLSKAVLRLVLFAARFRSRHEAFEPEPTPQYDVELQHETSGTAAR